MASSGFATDKPDEGVTLRVHDEELTRARTWQNLHDKPDEDVTLRVHDEEVARVRSRRNLDATAGPSSLRDLSGDNGRTRQDMDAMAAMAAKLDSATTKLDLLYSSMIERSNAEGRQAAEISRVERRVGKVQEREARRVDSLEVTVGQLVEGQKRQEERIEQLGNDVSKLLEMVRSLAPQVPAVPASPAAAVSSMMFGMVKSLIPPAVLAATAEQRPTCEGDIRFRWKFGRDPKPRDIIIKSLHPMTEKEKTCRAWLTSTGFESITELDAYQMGDTVIIAILDRNPITSNWLFEFPTDGKGVALQPHRGKTGIAILRYSSWTRTYDIQIFRGKLEATDSDVLFDIRVKDFVLLGQVNMTSEAERFFKRFPSSNDIGSNTRQMEEPCFTFSP